MISFWYGRGVNVRGWVTLCSPRCPLAKRWASSLRGLPPPARPSWLYRLTHDSAANPALPVVVPIENPAAINQRMVGFFAKPPQQSHIPRLSHFRPPRLTFHSTRTGRRAGQPVNSALGIVHRISRCTHAAQKHSLQRVLKAATAIHHRCENLDGLLLDHGACLWLKSASVKPSRDLCRVRAPHANLHFCSPHISVSTPTRNRGCIAV